MHFAEGIATPKALEASDKDVYIWNKLPSHGVRVAEVRDSRLSVLGGSGGGYWSKEQE